MKKLYEIFLLIYLICPFSITGQTSFREGFEKTNPVHQDSNLVLEEKIKLHQVFLEQAQHSNDSLRQLYGFLYLFYDYLQDYNYPEASLYLLKAENLADASKKPGWQGWAKHRRGILFLRLDKEKESIAAYEEAATLCEMAGDSLCLGESLEQISAMYAQLGNFDLAHQYFDRALLLIEEYGNERQISTTLSNFGALLSQQDRPTEAILYIERAMVVHRKNGYYEAEAKAMNNLADAYRRLGQTALAIKTWKACIGFNKSNGFSENMINNYMGLYVTYSTNEDYKNALHFLIKHIDLRDSIIGIRTQERIAGLEAKYESQQKELALQKSQAKLKATQHTLERGIGLFLFVLLLIAVGLWRWRSQAQIAKQEQAQNRENLTRMTRLLLEKNAQLSTLEEQVKMQYSNGNMASTPEGFEENLYNQRILTDEDWAAFKVYFEKSYPDYLFRLRSAFTSLSEAEERLFLFIKLKLSRKEVAAILGISTESVKKTRYRLRKRLELEGEMSLDDYIQGF